MIIYKKDIKAIDTRQNRIISLVPSITETLFYLGLGEKIVGITKWCKYPKHEIDEKPKIGGVVGIDLEKIKKLKPDLVFATKEENDKEEIKKISEFTNVYVGEVLDINDAYMQILDIGKLTQTYNKSVELVNKIKTDFLEIPNFKNKKCAYLVWDKPLMVVGGNTFINSILKQCKLKNVFEKRASYPAITIEDIKEKNPEIIFLCSEPFEFKDEHKIKFQKELPNTKIFLVDGEIFTWHGSHLLKTKKYCQNIKEML